MTNANEPLPEWKHDIPTRTIKDWDALRTALKETYGGGSGIGENNWVATEVGENTVFKVWKEEPKNLLEELQKKNIVEKPQGEWLGTNSHTMSRKCASLHNVTAASKRNKMPIVPKEAFTSTVNKQFYEHRIPIYLVTDYNKFQKSLRAIYDKDQGTSADFHIYQLNNATYAVISWKQRSLLIELQMMPDSGVREG
ncbi:hypothetical protein FBEOM_863 [Fusarium beomiforme]|uniref:Uncharacterized protein n=1 Tax=Fusarium beomiforme TaxID=44412 RepID=A0A9P5AX50_9HYPO|nr:hypothetical protein FBEOM_863 [Fusarium beomiforme]